MTKYTSAFQYSVIKNIVYIWKRLKALETVWFDQKKIVFINAFHNILELYFIIYLKHITVLVLLCLTNLHIFLFWEYIFKILGYFVISFFGSTSFHTKHWLQSGFPVDWCALKYNILIILILAYYVDHNMFVYKTLFNKYLWCDNSRNQFWYLLHIAWTWSE